MLRAKWVARLQEPSNLLRVGLRAWTVAALVLATNLVSGVGHRAIAEQQVPYTDVAVAYEAGDVELARRLAREHLTQYVALSQSSEDPQAMESGIRRFLGLAQTVLAFENQRLPAERLGNDAALQDLIASGLEVARVRRGGLEVRPAVAEHVEKEVGRTVAQWLRARSGRVPRARLEEIFATFREELRAAGVSRLDEALDPPGRPGVPRPPSPELTGNELATLRKAVNDYTQSLVRNDPVLLSQATGCNANQCQRILQSLQEDLEEEGVASLTGILVPDLTQQDLRLRTVPGAPNRMRGIVAELQATLIMKDGSVARRTFSKRFDFHRIGTGVWRILANESPGGRP